MYSPGRLGVDIGDNGREVGDCGSSDVVFALARVGANVGPVVVLGDEGVLGAVEVERLEAEIARADEVAGE